MPDEEQNILVYVDVSVLARLLAAIHCSVSQRLPFAVIIYSIIIDFPAIAVIIIHHHQRWRRTFAEESLVHIRLFE